MGLDDESIDTVNKVLANIQNIAVSNSMNIYTKDEQLAILDLNKNFKNNILRIQDDIWAYKQYFLPVNNFESCVFVDTCGVKFVKNKDYFKHKDIIDAGGFIGDSAIVLSEYTNKTVYTFEPISNNYRQMTKTVELNDKNNISPINMGLGSVNQEIEINVGGPTSSIIRDAVNRGQKEIIRTTTLDDFVTEHNIEVGLIKVDVEGYEQPFLQGAKNTITEFKPTILLSIYHLADDFFNCKKIIEDWGLGYNFRVIKPLDPKGQVLFETFLLAEVEA